jgi:spermidine synthase
MHLHGVDVTALEIEEAVVRANHLFQENSQGILDKPRFRLVIDDARSFLLATRESFDVIVTDVTNLKYKGNPSLYTVEYFGLMKARLSPGGIAAAWVPLGGESYQDLRILVASFYAVFPHTTVWFYSLETTHFLIFVGTEEKLAVPFDDVHPPREVQLDLASIGIRGSVAFASMILLGEEDVARVVDGVPPHTDNDPVLEFSDMKYYLMSNSIDNLELLLEHKREDLSSYFEASPRTIDLISDALQQAEAKHRSSIRYFQQAGD